MQVSINQLAQTFQLDEQELLNFLADKHSKYGIAKDRVLGWTTTTMHSDRIVADFKVWKPAYQPQD